MVRRLRDRSGQSRLELGSREWLALPDLGLPAIKAKVDTGARTSALHAFLIERQENATGSTVRFGIRPIPGRDDIEIYCSAPIVDSREVTSSNGEREQRYIIVTTAEMGGRRWPIQISLTNRAQMTYRMLLGRQAIQDHMVVVPNRSFLNPRLSYHLYRGSVPAPAAKGLDIALLRAEPAGGSAELRAFKAAAIGGGHRIREVEVSADARTPDAEGQSATGASARLDRFDAVVPFIGASSHSQPHLAILRQLQLHGAYTPNSADALLLARDGVRTRQLLRHHGLALEDAAPPGGPSGDGSSRFAVTVVGGQFACAVADTAVHASDAIHCGVTAGGDTLARADQMLAEAAARVLGLGLCTVRLIGGSDGAAGRLVAAGALSCFAEVIPDRPEFEALRTELAIRILHHIEAHTHRHPRSTQAASVSAP